MPSPDHERWLLRCPVDDAVIAHGIVHCPDCGLSTAPLRALAAMAAEGLGTAALVVPELAIGQVRAASALVPESENFLLDAGRALAAAGAYADARDALEKASSIAPGRTDIRDEARAVSEHIHPTAWLAQGPETAPSTTSDQASGSADRRAALAVAAAVVSPRDRLRQAHAAARNARDATVLGSPEYIAACNEVARIEVEISGLSSGRA
jgi:hypothetical protein